MDSRHNFFVSQRVDFVAGRVDADSRRVGFVAPRVDVVTKRVGVDSPRNKFVTARVGVVTRRVEADSPSNLFDSPRGKLPLGDTFFSLREANCLPLRQFSSSRGNLGGERKVGWANELPQKRS